MRIVARPLPVPRVSVLSFLRALYPHLLPPSRVSLQTSSSGPPFWLRSLSAPARRLHPRTGCPRSFLLIAWGDDPVIWVAAAESGSGFRVQGWITMHRVRYRRLIVPLSPPSPTRESPLFPYLPLSVQASSTGSFPVSRGSSTGRSNNHSANGACCHCVV